MYLILNTFSQSLSIPSDIAPYAYTLCTITCQLISSRSQETADVMTVTAMLSCDLCSDPDNDRQSGASCGRACW